MGFHDSNFIQCQPTFLKSYLLFSENQLFATKTKFRSSTTR